MPGTSGNRYESPEPHFSIVIPARNEERFIGHCLESIRKASRGMEQDVETIVVLNRCTDRTAEIAAGFGARLVREDAKNLSRIRNAGAGQARGKILITIDADSAMTPNTLRAVERALASRKTVGGGTWIRPERFSIGIVASILVMAPFIVIPWISGGMFWCLREDFEALGGFNENLITAEDLDFARRLRLYGKRVGRPFSTLRGGYIVTSCRKFDRYGDWAVITKPLFMWRLFRGSRQVADEYFYEFER